MKISEFIEMLGDEISSYLYEIHWFDKNGTDLDFSTTYKEALIEIFGHYYLSESGSIYITAKDGNIKLQLYIDKP